MVFSRLIEYENMLAKSIFSGGVHSVGETLQLLACVTFKSEEAFPPLQYKFTVSGKASVAARNKAGMHKLANRQFYFFIKTLHHLNIYFSKKIFVKSTLTKKISRIIYIKKALISGSFFSTPPQTKNFYNALLSAQTQPFTPAHRWGENAFCFSNNAKLKNSSISSEIK